MTSKPKNSDDTLHENYHEKDEKNALISWWFMKMK